MRYLTMIFACLVAALGLAAYATAGDHPDNVTLCHASGLAGTTKYETITVGYEAAFGPAGHFDENGTPNAGHEQDYLGECHETPPPVDVCPNLDGDQAEIPDGYHFAEDENGHQICLPDETPNHPVTAGVTFTEATCTTAPSFTLAKTNPGLRFYDVEGPDFVDGKPVPGGTYTFTALPDEGFTVVGQSVFVHTYDAAPTNCGAHLGPTGDAQVTCLLPAGTYQLSGHVDGQTADKVTPATLPGSTKGVTEVVVTRGDTSVRTTVTTLGDCGTTTTVTIVPPAAAPPAAAPPVSKPVAQPKPKVKAPVKHKTPVKAKPKPKPKPKPVKKPQKAPQTLSIN